MNANLSSPSPPHLRRVMALAAMALVRAACSRGWSAQSAHAAAPQAPASAAPALSPALASAAAQPAEGAPQAAEPLVRGLPDFSTLGGRYGGAVVNVEVVEKMPAGGIQGLSPNDPFYDFFRRFGIPPPDQGHEHQAPVRGAGSGFIVNSEGYILTNTHVVANADEVTVRLTDRREFAAKVIGADERTDVAVIKISATSRAVPGESYVPFIQTDVPVNPGNSGGPLFNMAGEVIGINSQIFSRTGGFMGVSFALPIDVARNVEEQLIRTGHVVRGRIGVTIQDVNAQLADSFGLDRPRGALVSSGEKDGPAAHAGITAGDVILAVGGHPIERYGELSSAVAAMKPGSDASLAVWRNGREQNFSVKVVELREQQQTIAGRGNGQGEHEGGGQAGALGLTVRPLAPREKEQAGTQGSLVVEQVTGPAQAAEIEPGDIILGINGKRVHTGKLRQEPAAPPGKAGALLIQREAPQIFVPLPLP